MTPKDPNPIFSVQNTYTDSYRNRNYQSHRSRSPYNKHDPNNKESSQFNKFCSYCRKNGHSISRCFIRQMNKYRESNEKARQNYPIQRQQQNTQKVCCVTSLKITKIYQTKELQYVCLTTQILSK